MGRDKESLVSEGKKKKRKRNVLDCNSYVNSIPTRPVIRMLSVMGCPFERPNESWNAKNDLH